MTTDVNGISLHYEIHGQGAPLLWLHGLFGSGSDWQYVFDSVPDSFQLIAPDLRGHGRTTNPTGRFTFRQTAEDVAALLRHLGLERVKAVGVSGGGLTLLHLATSAPSTVERMVIVSAPPYFPDQARAIQRATSEAMFGEHELALMRQRHARGDDQVRELIGYSRALGDTYDDVNFTPPYLGTITAETLIVFGDQDPLYPVSLAFDLHQAIPRSRLWIIPGGGHAPVFADAAARFREVAIPFLRVTSG